MRLALLLLTLALLAGCLGSAPADETDTQTDNSDPAGSQDDATLYLTGDRGLRPTEPTGEPERVPAGNFYTAWAQGEEQPTWTGEPLADSLHVQAVDLVFFYTAESATATTGPRDQGFPEFVVYLGTEAAPMAWASVEGPDVVQEGEQVRVEAELAPPEGGLVLPAGAAPVVKLAPVQGQGSAEDTRIAFLVNGTDTPSRAVLDAQPIEVPEASSTQAVDENGYLAGSAYALGADDETPAADTYEVDATGVLGLEAQLERLEGAGVADIDLELLGPEGEVVARSVTPEDDEGLFLREPNVAAIGEGTWTLRVVNYGNAAVEYRLEASVLEPASG